MQRVVVNFMVAFLMLSLPALLSVVEPSVAVVGEPGTLGAVSAQIQSSMKSMIDILSAISYIAGIGFGLKSAMALKQYTEEGRSYAVEPDAEKVKEELKEIFKKPESPLNDKKIESIIEQIKNKSNILLSNPQINNEIEFKHIAEKSISAYVPKVVETYVQISPDLRKKASKNGLSAHDMTCQQLELIYDGLCDIELKLLNKNHDRLKVSGKFLNQIFKKKENSEKAIELEM